MIKAGKIHKERIIHLFAECYDTNKSVNWIVKQDAKREERIRSLIDYSFETCMEAGEIYLTDDEDGAVMCSISDNKLPFLEEAFLTARFVLEVTGIDGVAKALRREEYINSFHPNDYEFIYIWFIAVDKTARGKGIGSKMLGELIDKSNREKLPIYLETSEESNVRFYQKYGFEIYHVSPEEMFRFKLYFLRRLPEEVTDDR